MKPDGVERRLTGEIIARLERKGLSIVAAELRTITREVAETHYGEHSDKPFFGELVDFITRSPAMVMVIEGPGDTYKVVRTLMGATNPKEGKPHPRLRFSRVCGARDRPLVPWRGLSASTVPCAGQSCLVALQQNEVL